MSRTRWVWSLALGGCSLTSQVGCTSIKSTVVDRDDCARGGWRTHKHRGLPVVVRVPKSIRLSIVESRYFSVDGKSYLSKNLQWVSTNAVPNGGDCEPLTTRELKHTIHETPETFYVDMARPAAGTLGYGAEIDEKTQFFKGVNTDLTDTTLKDITKAVGDVADALPKPKTGTPVSAKAKDNTNAGTRPFIEVTSEIAYKVFDVKSPNLTEEMREFALGYLNDCHRPCETVSTVPCPPPAKAEAAAAPAILPTVPAAASVSPPAAGKASAPPSVPSFINPASRR